MPIEAKRVYQFVTDYLSGIWKICNDITTQILSNEKISIEESIVFFEDKSCNRNQFRLEWLKGIGVPWFYENRFERSKVIFTENLEKANNQTFEKLIHSKDPITIIGFLTLYENNLVIENIRCFFVPEGNRVWILDRITYFENVQKKELKIFYKE